MEYEKTDQGGKIIKWHVDDDSGVPRKVRIYHRIKKYITAYITLRAD